MAILIRHTTPQIAKGICYGQADLDIMDSFEREVDQIMLQLPATISHIYSSPLQRCKKLAEQLATRYKISSIIFSEALMEMNFGNWEMKAWNEIEPDTLNPWMEDFVYSKVPNGESFDVLNQRVLAWWSKQQFSENTIIVTHAGPIRCILSYKHQTALKDAFTLYPIDYGAVVNI